MEAWRSVWRDGFVPSLSTAGLTALRAALATDDFRLSQGSTTVPAAAASAPEWPCEGACAVGYCGWQGQGMLSVGEVDEHFARACWEADERLQETAACRHFLNWFDDTPRDDMRRDLLAEVELALAARRLPIAIVPPKRTPQRVPAFS
jgi:hypothetical protein